MSRLAIRGFAVAISVLAISSAGAARAGNLSDVIPSLYGGDGIQLNNSFFFTQPANLQDEAQFSLPSLDELSGLSAALGATANQLAFASGGSSFTFDVQQAVFVRTTESLGPLFSERADTVGKGKLNFAWSFSRQEFKHFQGDSLSGLDFQLGQTDWCVPPGAGISGVNCVEPNGSPGNPAFEVDQLLLNLDVELDQNIISFFTTYGITSRWDVGIVLPLVDTHLDVKARATILRDPSFSQSLLFNRFCDPNSPSTCVPNSEIGYATASDPNGRNEARDEKSGDDFGIGDLVLRTKYNFIRGDATLPDLAAVGAVTFPTGDEDNFRGTGTTELAALFVASKTYFEWLTPHFNGGFQFGLSDSDLNNARYILGADARFTSRITLSLDILGRTAFSSDVIGNTTVDLGLAAKVNPFSTFNVFVGGLLPLNPDSGLRSDIAWTAGVEYTY